MNYRSVADLNAQIIRWLPNLPRGFELVVAMSGSGLLPATLIALHLDLPMTDVGGFIKRAFINGGRRPPKRIDALPSGSRVLVVGDGTLQEAQVEEVKKKLGEADLNYSFSYAAVYAKPGMESYFDFFCELLPLPRIFEWNLMHHDVLENSCMDIDGVLCRDPLKHENDDGVEYERFLGCTEPLRIPTHTVGWLVTCRLEKYRARTEGWLAENGVKYNELVMMDYSTAADRRAANRYSEYKADVYTRTGAMFFIESSLRQATKIAEISGKPVYCTDTSEMIQPRIGSPPRPHWGSVAGEPRSGILRFPDAIRRNIRHRLSALREKAIAVSRDWD